jgi:hypothetical protein
MTRGVPRGTPRLAPCRSVLTSQAPCLWLQTELQRELHRIARVRDVPPPPPRLGFRLPPKRDYPPTTCAGSHASGGSRGLCAGWDRGCAGSGRVRQKARRGRPHRTAESRAWRAKAMSKAFQQHRSWWPAGQRVRGGRTTWFRVPPSVWKVGCSWLGGPLGAVEWRRAGRWRLAVRSPFGLGSRAWGPVGEAVA